MASSTRFRWAADVVLALVMLVLFVADRPAQRPARQSAEVPRDWRRETSTGIKVGPDNAKLTIVEFMDLECPFCAAWAARVDSLISMHPEKVQVVFHHYPLENHPHAIPAAIAAECAHRQGAFYEFQRKALNTQKQFGSKNWQEFASESGVRDLDLFSGCVKLPADSFPRIAYGLALGKRTRVPGTPTIWINGKVDKPSLNELVALVR